MSLSNILEQNNPVTPQPWTLLHAQRYKGLSLDVGKLENVITVNGDPISEYKLEIDNSAGPGDELLTELAPRNYQLKTLQAGTNITLTPTADNITISASGSAPTFNGFYVNSTAPPVDTYVEDSLSPMLFNNVIYNTGSLNWVPNTQTTNVAQFDTILITGRIFIKTMGYENITLQIKDVANPIGDNLIILEIKSTTPPLTSVAVNRYYEFAYTWRKLGPITGPVSISLLDLNGSDWVYQVNTSTYLCMTKLF